MRAFPCSGVFAQRARIKRAFLYLKYTRTPNAHKFASGNPYRLTARRFGFLIFQKQNRPSKTAKIRRVQTMAETRADYGEIISYAARGLFNADVQPTSAICRPVEACETAATRIAEDENIKRAFFCAPFLSLSERKERIPVSHGKGQSLSHASRASSLYTKEPFARGLFSADV